MYVGIHKKPNIGRMNPIKKALIFIANNSRLSKIKPTVRNTLNSSPTKKFLTILLPQIAPDSLNANRAIINDGNIEHPIPSVKLRIFLYLTKAQHNIIEIKRYN